MITKVNAILFGCLALVYLSLSGDFWRQLPTYFWTSESVVITGHTLQMSPAGNGPMGEVTFVTSDGQPRRFTDRLSRRYDFGDVHARTAEFIEAHAPGTEHLAFISPDYSRASLGHFPRSYSPWFAILGCVCALNGLLTILRWRKDFGTRTKNSSITSDAA